MRYIIFGHKGQLGKEFVKILTNKGDEWFGYDYPDFNICDYVSMFGIIEMMKPDAVINCAAYSNVEAAEINKDIAYKVNDAGVSNIASICKTNNIKFVSFSTDYVFDGLKQYLGLYKENDKPNPLNYYGETKLKGEEIILENNPESLVLRTSWLYGDAPNNFINKLNQWTTDTDKIKVVNDEISIPTSTEIVVNTTISAINSNLKGLYHLTSTGYCSRYEFAKAYFEIIKKDIIVYPCDSKEFYSIVKRPKFSAMDNSKICSELDIEIPTWIDVLKRYLSGNDAEQQSTIRKRRGDVGLLFDN